MRLTLDLDIRPRDLAVLGYDPDGEGRSWTRDHLRAALHLLLGRAIIAECTDTPTERTKS